MIALPETFSLMGNRDEKLLGAEELNKGESLLFLQDFALKHKVAIIGGSIFLKTTIASKVKNTCLVIDENGQLLAHYDKIHLFKLDYDADNVYDESEFVEAGNEVKTIDLSGVKIGLSICYDIRFPELYRKMVLEGAQILFVPSAFTVPTGKDHWEILLRARAIENQCYVVAPAQFGRHEESRRITYGRSMIVDPWGQILAQCPDREDVIVADLDLAYLKEVRDKLPALKDTRRDMFFSH